MGIKVMKIFKFTVLSIVLSALLIFILAIISYFSAISENTLTVIVYISVVLSVFVGALFASKTAQNKRLLHALGVSVLYYAILFLASIIINKTISYNSHFFTMTIGIFASGILGAVMGK